MALLKVPVAPNRGTLFDYRGTQLTLSPLKLNPYIGVGVWSTDLTWLEDNVTVGVYGIVLSAGVDILAQYSTPIPSMFVLSSNNTRNDIESTSDLNLYIKEKDL